MTSDVTITWGKIRKKYHFVHHWMASGEPTILSNFIGVWQCRFAFTLL